MSTAAPAQPAKVSFLKRIGQIAGKILSFLANDAKPIADQAAAVAEVLIPQFAPEIAFADNLITRIAKQAVVTESLAAQAGAAVGTGANKLSAVLLDIGPEIDTWVQNAFPGAVEVSIAAKSGLVNAVVAILNELYPATASSTGAPAAPPATAPTPSPVQSGPAVTVTGS
jgi:hypothetical protein